MKIVSKEIYYGYNSQRYDLNETFSKTLSNKGLVICYALATCANSKMVSLELEAKTEEVGIASKWYKKYSYESFVSIFTGVENFLASYDNEDFGTWRLTTIYDSAEIGVSGSRNDTEIGLSYPENKRLNLLPWLSEVESNTYGFNDYDKRILSMLKTDFKMSEKRAVLAVQKLLSHKDIYDEFVLVATSGKYAKESSAVSVEGYTAEMLNSNYPLSVLGAYNYLIYLREAPKEALEDLKKGLPRK